jgi:hypothetical protein
MYFFHRLDKLIDGSSAPNKQAGNTNRSGRLSTVDLLINVACFVKNKIMLAISKAADLN